MAGEMCAAVLGKVLHLVAFLVPGEGLPPAGSCWNAGRAAPGLNPSLQGHCPSSHPNWGVSEGLLRQSPSGGPMPPFLP